MPERLHPADVDLIAARVADLIEDTRSQGLVDTTTVARMLSVSEDYCRDHAAELGGVKLGDGPRSPLRFDLVKVNEEIERRRVGGPKPKRPGARRGRPRKSDVDLLPLPKWAT